MTPFSRICALALGLAFAQPAAALPPLHEDPEVLGGFYAIGLADELRKNCPRIEPRLIRAFSYLQALERLARDKGYSSADIDALQDNKAEKEKLKARISRDLAARGATPDNPEGYCAVGEEEIAKDSAAGRLLKVK
jgi:hypothetical protein